MEVSAPSEMAEVWVSVKGIPPKWCDWKMFAQVASIIGVLMDSEAPILQSLPCPRIILRRYSDTPTHGRYTYPRSIGFSDFKKKEKNRYTADTPWIHRRYIARDIIDTARTQERWEAQSKPTSDPNSQCAIYLFA
ncbi:hypothetical protein ACQ4PT_016017 [Festuca glaucescens]